MRDWGEGSINTAFKSILMHPSIGMFHLRCDVFMWGVMYSCGV